MGTISHAASYAITEPVRAQAAYTCGCVLLGFDNVNFLISSSAKQHKGKIYVC